MADTRSLSPHDIDWALVGRYAAGECTPEERLEVERWLAAARTHVAGVAAIDWVAEHADETTSAARREVAWAALQADVVGGQAPSLRHRVPVMSRVMKIAAALLVVVGLSIASYKTLGAPGSENSPA